jgi:hypothetical protein
MARAFENNPTELGDVKEMMKILKKQGENKYQIKEDIKEIEKEVARITATDYDLKNKTQEPKKYHLNPEEQKHRREIDLR